MSVIDNLIDEDNQYTFRQLMDKLYVDRDLILTIPNTQVDELKRGLISRKNKDSRLSKKDGLLVQEETMKFNVYASTVENHSCVRVSLEGRKSITVTKLEIPNDEL